MNAIKIHIAIAATFGGAVAFGQSSPAEKIMTIEEYEPKSTLVVPQHPVTRAKYPIIDVHNHQNRCQDPKCLDKLVSDMDGINLRVMVNLSGGSGERLKRNVEAQSGRYKDRFVIFANLDFNGIDDPGYGARTADQLAQDVKNG